MNLGSIKSEWKRIERACPQGLALGPLLCNIFQNDLTYVINLHLSIYADDHQVDETARDPETANNNLIRNANNACEWYASNLLKGNLSKYQSMTLKNNSAASPYTFRETPLNLQTVLSC